MADGPALALQAALVARLRANAGLSALIGARVYDAPPQSVVFPYVRIGQIESRPLRLTAPHTHEELTFSVEAHSRPVTGRVEVSRIAFAIRLALDGAAPPVVGYSVDWIDWIAQSVSRGQDGQSYVASVAFEASLRPV
jgi:hypothetical protein